MDKIWFKNNLNAIGKWGGTSFLFGIAITAFMFGINFPLQAYVLETIPMSTKANQLSDFKFDSDIINNVVNSLKSNQGVSPSPIKSPSQNIDFSRFFSSSKVSVGDVTNFLREAAITGINLSILVISVTSQILKGLLSVLK